MATVTEARLEPHPLGDVDLVTSAVHGRARLWRNDSPRRGHWLSVTAREETTGASHEDFISV